MDIYAILIILALCAFVVIAWFFVQKLNTRYQNIEREVVYIKNTLEKISSQVEFYGSDANKAVLEKLGAISAPPPAPPIEKPAPDEGEGIVSRVETTLRQIQGIALEMKDAAPIDKDAVASDDARLWNTINGVRSDAAEARDALERSQKRLRQLGDCLDDSTGKLRALDRRIKQFKRRERAGAPAVETEPDDMDMKL